MGLALKGADRERNDFARVYSPVLIFHASQNGNIQCVFFFLIRSFKLGYYEKLVRFCSIGRKKKF
jgi:hypothetical protein